MAFLGQQDQRRQNGAMDEETARTDRQERRWDRRQRMQEPHVLQKENNPRRLEAGHY